MSKAGRSEKKTEGPEVITICRNRRAAFDYEIQDRIECGIVLTGTEVKSLREGHASLNDAYAKVEDGELWLLGAEIPQYVFGNRQNHQPKRPRKLLLHRREIAKFAAKSEQQGFTLVPLRLYFLRGWAKVELAVAKGKRQYDKRESIKRADASREINQILRSRRKIQ